MGRVAPLLIAAVLTVTAGARGAGAFTLRDAVAEAGVAPGAAVAAEPSAFDLDRGTDGGPISPTRAVLYSLLLPGLGDYQLGHRSRAAVFFSVEGTIWISYGVFTVQGQQREDEYQSLAVRFAGVSGTGHSDDFYAALREYDSSVEYEAEIKNEARIYDGYLHVLTASQLEDYFVQNRIEDYEPWQWTSFDRRLQYSEVRSSSKTSYRRADYMLAAAAANRVVSAIVAYASARGARSDDTLGYRVDFVPTPHGIDVFAAISRSF